MGTFVIILGAAVVIAGLNDIFHTLLHPSGRGRVSHWITMGVWRISRRSGHKLGHLAGPTAMVGVIALWTLQALGWALIYYPHVPEGISYSPGLDPGRYNDFAEALYISLVTLATLGYGDVVPVNPWLRLLAPIQGLTGFALLTAALSWLSQIYPAGAIGQMGPAAKRVELRLSRARFRSASCAGHTLKTSARTLRWKVTVWLLHQLCGITRPGPASAGPFVVSALPVAWNVIGFVALPQL